MFFVPVLAAATGAFVAELIRDHLRESKAKRMNYSQFGGSFDMVLGDSDFGEFGAEFGGQYDIMGGDGTTELVGGDAHLLDALAMGDDTAVAQHAQHALRQGNAPVAAKLMNAAKRMRAARAVDPGAIGIKRNSLTKRRRFPLGIAPFSVPAGQTATLPSAPQNLFRGERLVVPSTIAPSFGVADIKVGTQSQLVASGEIPGELFSEVAIDTHMHFTTAEIGNQVIITARNKTTDDVEFSAGVMGTVAQA